MDALERLAQIRESYQALPLESLRITAHLAAPVAHYHDLHLDGILAYVVMEMAMQAPVSPLGDTWIEVPLPLGVLWRDDQTGVPLWASTDFVPVDLSEDSATYHHRRAPEPSMTKRNLDTGAGRHKERRSPIPTTHTNALYADCIGNADALRELLKRIGSIGKKRHTLGAVREWTIEAMPSFSLVDEQRRARRPLPLLALLGGTVYPLPLDFSFQGIAPPYWHITTRMMCVAAGTLINEDVRMLLEYR